MYICRLCKSVTSSSLSSIRDDDAVPCRGREAAVGRCVVLISLHRTRLTNGSIEHVCRVPPAAVAMRGVGPVFSCLSAFRLERR